ncbi:hypothetical protein SKAU_G00425800 [Synaphobranchus kaupii]|uniref:NOTCH1 EGF-like calcium-binding domain-containing protein n=1 Tax=Synaphobranchus kaupii TaxID=118154 RepID=A0A9Q1E536_SYNKA|nr:hypothetical protein SKAU_G00425800 [Synaphobranchus kaupii]
MGGNIEVRDVLVTDCGACDADATCDRSENASVCSCWAGFVGDDLHCYNRSACEGGICCGSGYRWSSERGCVDIDECVSPEEACPSPLVCKNTLGSFHCQPVDEGAAPRIRPCPEIPPTVERSGKSNSTEHSVVFHCENVTCPAGEDCLTQNNGSQCLDPCVHNSRLDDYWNSTSYGNINQL